MIKLQPSRDGAPNMIASFDFLSRTDINRIQCMVHKIHLVVCNGLGLWLKRLHITEENSSSIIDVDEHLSQTVRTTNINKDIEDEEEEEEEDEDKGDQEQQVIVTN